MLLNSDHTLNVFLLDKEFNISQFLIALVRSIYCGFLGFHSRQIMHKHFDYPLLIPIIHKPSFLIILLGHFHNWWEGAFDWFLFSLALVWKDITFTCICRLLIKDQDNNSWSDDKGSLFSSQTGCLWQKNTVHQMCLQVVKHCEIRGHSKGTL